MNKKNRRLRRTNIGRRIGTLMLAVFLAISGFPTIVNAEMTVNDPVILYDNDFSVQGNPLEGWQFRDTSAAEIVEEDGNAVLHLRGNNGENGNGYGIAYYPAVGWKDRSLELDLKINEFLQPMEAYSGFALKQHGGNPGSFFAGAYYRSAQDSKKFQLIQSGSPALTEGVPDVIEEGKYYTCRLDVAGKTTTFYIKEKSAEDYGDPIFRYTNEKDVWEGGIGLEAIFADLYLDNIVVKSLPTQLVLNEYAMELEKGGTKQLAAEAMGAQVYWSSTDEGVAKVSQEGIVTGVSQGEAEITVTLSANPDLTESCTVTVADSIDTYSIDGEIKDRFLLNYQEVDINLDIAYPLPLYLTTGYYTEPSGTGKVTWNSDNEEVATVNSEGRVTARTAGTAVITALHSDYPDKTAKCQVNIYRNTECSNFYYVSPDGSDQNPGTEEEPFATIQQARDTIRDLEMLPNGGITVILEDGTYYESETIVFEPQDSGTKEEPIIYKARNEGKAIITGEEAITGWTKANNEEGMSSAAEGKVYVADVKPGWRFHDLYVNGERQQVSRSFNTDKWREWPTFYGRAPLSYDSEKGAKVVFGDGELDGLEGNDDVELVLLPVMYWNCIPLVKYINADNNTAYLQSQIPSNFWPDHFGTGEGYYNILNTLKYLDQPGEWCIDSKAGKVYYWPQSEDTIVTDKIVAPKPYELLRLQGDGVDQKFESLVEYLSFEGISFEYTDRLPENEFPEDWVIRNAENPDAAVYFDGTKNCRLVNSEIRHSGTYGVTVNHFGQNNEILHNQMHDLGSGGVQLYGYGVGTVDVNHNNVVMYNSIYNMGVAPYQHSPGLGIFGSGRNTMAFNYIAGAPYAGISIVGTDENSISRTNPDTRAAYDMFGKQSSQYGIRFEDLEQLPDEEKDGVNGEYFSIGQLAEKYQHSERNVAEYNYLEDYSQSMDDGGALYSWYCGLGNVYAYNSLKEELSGSRTWVFWRYMDDRAIGFTLQNLLVSGNFDATIDKSFTPYANRIEGNAYAKYPQVPAGYVEQKAKILDTTEEVFGGFKLGESQKPEIILPVEGSDDVKIPTSIVLKHCENASLYKVEIATDANFTNIIDTIETHISVLTTDSLDFDTQYYCRVTSREYLGDSRVSDVVSFRTEIQSKPEEVLQGTKLTNDIDAVLVQWTQVAKTQVNVYRRAEGEKGYQLIGENVEGSGYLDSQVKGNTTYIYQVAAVNSGGEGPKCQELQVTTREWNVLFSDDFDSGKISDLWTDDKGNQVNKMPEYSVVEDGQWKPDGSWCEYYVGLNEEGWEDYAVEADITFNGLKPSAEEYSGFGLISRANMNPKTFYQAIVRTNRTTMEIVKCDNTEWKNFVTVDLKKKPSAGDVYRMRLENVGKISRIYLNGVLIAEIEDESLKSGGIGLAYGNDDITIDNVQVYPHPSHRELSFGYFGIDIKSKIRIIALPPSIGGILMVYDFYKYAFKHIIFYFCIADRPVSVHYIFDRWQKNLL